MADDAPDAPTPDDATPDAEARRAASRRGAWVSLATFLGALVAVDQGFQAARPGRGLAAESIYIQKPRAFGATEGADVVVVGDSRVLHGAHPQAIEDAVRHELGLRVAAYNAGLSGAPPMAHLAWVRRVLARPRKPRVVVVSISPYMFSSRIATAASRESLTTIYRPQDLPALVRAGAPAEDVATALTASLFGTYRLRPRVLELLLRASGLREAAPTGDRGWLPGGSVDPATQASRAAGRAMGYRTEMWPPARFGNEQVGYFVETLRELRDAGVRTLVINSPSASQLELAYGPTSIYDQHVRFVRATAARFGAAYADLRTTPAVVDADYTDGDHLSNAGAARFSAWLAHEHLVPMLGARATGRPAGCRAALDFEDESLPGWQRTGPALESPVTALGRQSQAPIHGMVGHRCLSTFAQDAGDGATGSAESPPFTLDGEVRLRVGGGSTRGVGVSLVVDGVEVASARGADEEPLRDVTWDTRSMRGRSARLRVTDSEAGAWGHVNVDDVAVCP